MTIDKVDFVADDEEGFVCATVLHILNFGGRGFGIDEPKDYASLVNGCISALNAYLFYGVLRLADTCCIDSRGRS